MSIKLDNKISIYYPYFEIERKNLCFYNTDHKLYLKVLSLLGNNIIIPPSHIRSSVKYVTMLEKSFIDFFDNGTLITSYCKGQRDIKDFIQKKEEDDFRSGRRWDRDDKLIAKRAVDVLKHSTEFIERNVNAQSLQFLNFIRKGFFEDSRMIREWQDNYPKNSMLLLGKELNKIKYNKGYAISKTDIEHVFNRIKKQVPRKLLMDVSSYVNHAYFFTGGMGNNSIVGYSPYFQKTYLGDFLRNDRYGTNLFYDPNFFCTVLETLDIILSPLK